jgi:beta-galactosidase
VTVRLPHTMRQVPANHFDESDSQFTAVYRKTLRVPREKEGLRALLVVEAAMGHAVVRLDGVERGRHDGGWTSFIVALGVPGPGVDHRVEIEVDSSERPDTPPWGHVVDYLGFGGLYREVGLAWVGEAALGSLLVFPRRDRPGPWSLDCRAEVGGKASGSLDWVLEGVEGPVASGTVNLAPGQHLVTWCAPAPGVRPWEPEDPVLYRLTARLVVDGIEVDRLGERTGFRTVEFRSDGFFLNGARRFLRGLNRHQSFPYAGYAMPRSAQRRDAEILGHDLGLTVVRSSHYPPSRHFLDRCDEIGLLVIEEIPGWQHIGDRAWQDRSVGQVTEMIAQDGNHPSVILWGVRINESSDHHEFYERTNAAARALDPWRPTGGVRNFGKSELLEDVYTFNDFTHAGGVEVLAPVGKVAGPRVPYLVTEHTGHMYPTKATDPESRLVEHALRHLRVLDAAQGAKRTSGALGWCLADYNTHRDFGSGDRVCYHGVLDLFRIPKPAAAAYRSQAEGTPFLEVASLLAPGDHDGANLPPVVVFTNCDRVELVRAGRTVGFFEPDRDRFPHLPHPPVFVDDFIGDELERNEGLSPGDARRVKKVFAAVTRYGQGRLPLVPLVTMGWVMLKHRWTFTDAADLFVRYVGRWGDALEPWTFVGWKDGQRTTEVRRGPHGASHLAVVPDQNTLHDGPTWDTVRVVIRHEDDQGQLLRYSQEAVTLATEGPIELVGPATVALVGGARAVWVRSLPEAGVGALVVRSPRFGDQSVTIRVTCGPEDPSSFRQ